MSESKVQSRGWSCVGVEPRLLHPCFFTPHLLLLLLNTEDEWVGERNEQEVDQKTVRSSQNEMEEIRAKQRKQSEEKNPDLR